MNRNFRTLRQSLFAGLTSTSPCISRQLLSCPSGRTKRHSSTGSKISNFKILGKIVSQHESMQLVLQGGNPIDFISHQSSLLSQLKGDEISYKFLRHRNLTADIPETHFLSKRSSFARFVLTTEQVMLTSF